MLSYENNKKLGTNLGSLCFSLNIFKGLCEGGFQEHIKVKARSNESQRCNYLKY
ncbi:hypothetical protein HanIR_Chr01g0040461 [Helianthus annuus]|nr:hypothetical protein HanIR_Chr01g0040461 [Helianthus annuus]